MGRAYRAYPGPLRGATPPPLRLAALLAEAAGERSRATELLAVALAIYGEGVAGRPRLSRLLGLGDRKVRNLVASLRSLGLVRIARAGAMPTERLAELLTGFDARYSPSTLCMLKASRDYITVLKRRVVRLRDDIAILLASPDRLRLIGSCVDGAVDVPGAPPEIVEAYIEYLPVCAATGHLVWALFEDPRCYRCCAAFLQASAALSMSTGTG